MALGFDARRAATQVAAALSVLVVLTCTAWAQASDYPSASFLQCDPGPVMSALEDGRAPVKRMDDDAGASLLPLDEDEGCDGLIIERSGQVPVCLLEGASGVAERPIHEVDGTAIEKGQGFCPELEANTPTATQNDQGPSDPPKSMADANVTLEELPSPPPAPGSELLRAGELAPPSALWLRVFRPPRR